MQEHDETTEHSAQPAPQANGLLVGGPSRDVPSGTTIVPQGGGGSCGCGAGPGPGSNGTRRLLSSMPSAGSKLGFRTSRRKRSSPRRQDGQRRPERPTDRPFMPCCPTARTAT